MNLHETIDQMLLGVEFGTVQITVKRHDSHTTSVDGHKLTSHKVDGNEQALSIVIALLKTVQASEETGSLTFTIAFDSGRSKRVVVQDTKRQTLSV